MKLLTLIIHHHLKQEAADFFRTLDQIKGFTFSQVEGHGSQLSLDRALSDMDKVVGYTPHIRVEILLDEGTIAEVLKAVGQSDFAAHKKLIYWVTPVERHGRLE